MHKPRPTHHCPSSPLCTWPPQRRHTDYSHVLKFVYSHCLSLSHKMIRSSGSLSATHTTDRQPAFQPRDMSRPRPDLPHQATCPDALAQTLPFALAALRTLCARETHVAACQPTYRVSRPDRNHRDSRSMRTGFEVLQLRRRRASTESRTEMMGHLGAPSVQKANAVRLSVCEDMVGDSLEQVAQGLRMEGNGDESFVVVGRCILIEGPATPIRRTS